MSFADWLRAARADASLVTDPDRVRDALVTYGASVRALARVDSRDALLTFSRETFGLAASLYVRAQPAGEVAEVLDRLRELRATLAKLDRAAPF